MFHPACDCAFLCHTFFLVPPSPAVSPIPSILVSTSLSLFLPLSFSLSVLVPSLTLDHCLPHHRKGSNVEPWGSVEGHYKLVLSQNCHCHLLLASGKKLPTTIYRKVLAHREAHGRARKDSSKRAACMAGTARTQTCSAHAQMPLQKGSTISLLPSCCPPHGPLALLLAASLVEFMANNHVL